MDSECRTTTREWYLSLRADFAKLLFFEHFLKSAASKRSKRWTISPDSQLTPSQRGARIQSGRHGGVTSWRPTIGFKVHATEDERADVLGLHVALEVDKDGGQVVVGVVGDAGGGDGLEELGLRELPGQAAQVLVDQGAQWDAGGRRRQWARNEFYFFLKTVCWKTFVLFCQESLVFLTYPGL